MVIYQGVTVLLILFLHKHIDFPDTNYSNNKQKYITLKKHYHGLGNF